MVASAWIFLFAVALWVGWIAIDERGREAVAAAANGWFVPALPLACLLVVVGVVAAQVVILWSLIGGIQ